MCHCLRQINFWVAFGLICRTCGTNENVLTKDCQTIIKLFFWNKLLWMAWSSCCINQGEGGQIVV